MAITLAQKLLIKTGHKIRLINAPEGFDLGELPEAVSLNTDGTEQDAVLLFIKSHADLAANIEKTIAATKHDALLWVAYPKQTSKVKADINRDTLNQALQKLNYEGISIIAIDDTWSALRFRPKEKVGK
jgi:hypothetical protein